ncbi:MAG TPA: hypothetical protein VID68_10000 [Solirubrobacteraceae bacterium]
MAAAMPTFLRRVLAVAAVIYAAVGASVAAAAPNPSQNMPISFPASCVSPTSSACEDAIVADLDRARAAMGLSAYTLPADFDTLPPPEQIFILSNLDRTAYGLLPASGLSPQLDGAAQTGVADSTDPDPSSDIPAGSGAYSWDANWAGGYPNAPYAYYGWMYDDGYGSPNIDCSTPSAPGCWGHRQDVLAFPTTGQVVMGAASGTGSSGSPGYAMTMVWTASTSSWTSLDYTWAQALADIASSPSSGGGTTGGGGGGGGGGTTGGGGGGGGTTGAGGNPGTPPSGGGSTGTAPAGAQPPAPTITPPAPAQNAAPSQPIANTVAPADPTAVIALVVAHAHRVRFVLGTFGQSSGYQCALVRAGHEASAAPVFRTCGTVRVYRNLPAGRYTFLVRAIGGDGSSGATARHSFTIHA